ncbi:CBS domain-containing protein [Phormidium sp. LEGE 05292]|uniref:CBS domain-containing protein n=1 Tax=[Phormidium] sp. LEGE 05292 TaxID=767427 RepID=UPI00187F1772|nr:CBS domain-containing protein [Phormidium sp. LEGE 05292]MBE9229775.1 CBS domain-containing protein [Phormidium sp. LEGE 05292]
MDFPNPEHAIDYHPLTVSPNTPLLEMMSLMNQVRGRNCVLDNQTETKGKNSSSPEVSLSADLVEQEVNSCVLVIEEDYIKGIVTERDIVNLLATGQNLAVPVAVIMTKQVITLSLSQFKDVFVALTLLRQHKIRHLPIVDDRNKLIGIVTAGTIRRILQPASLLAMRRVGDVMTREVIQATSNTSVLHLAQLMNQHQLSSIVITSELNSQELIPLGIVTERDIVQMQILDLNLAQVSAETVMSQPLFCLHPEDSLWLAHQEMQRRLVRRLVVVGKAGELVGIVTQSSILRSLDPIELYNVVETLQQLVENQTTQLIQANQQLHQKTEEVYRALEKEQELNKIRSQFISMIFHEFRNPLSAILMSVQSLEMQNYKLPELRAKKFLEQIQNSAQQMLKLIEDLLVIGQTELGKIQANPVPINLAYFCRQLLEELQISDNSGHYLNFTCQDKQDFFFDFDEQSLRYIISNLLSNALKYSPQGSTVKLILSVDTEQATFQVIDRGIGILPEDKSNLFEPFYRGQNVHSIAGSGLGLAIVKNYVELLKGQITFTSEVGVGTTFTVILPLNNS